MAGVSIEETLELWASSLRHGWHRHVSLVMTAFAMLAATTPTPRSPTPRSPTPRPLRP